MLALLVVAVIAALRRQLTLPYWRLHAILGLVQILLGIQRRVEVAGLVRAVRRLGSGDFLKERGRLLRLIVGAFGLDALRLVH